MLETTSTILLVDDEPDILEFLAYNLKRNGYSVHTANNGLDGIKKAQETKPDLIILDVMMPKMDGIETCDKMRSMPELGHPIIVFLTARSEEYSQISGLEVGADDYISKPIKPKLFVSKVKSLLRRKEITTSSIDGNTSLIVDVHLSIDKEKHIVFLDHKEIIFPKKEFALLLLLASRIDVVFTRDEIFSRVWESDVIVGDRTIDVHIRKIREKIGNHYIQTIKGIGYKLVAFK